MNLASIFKGVTGELELGRIWLSVGTGSMVICPPVFQTIAILHGQAWNAAEFCGGYGIGLGGLITSGLLAIGSKDKSGAIARQTQAMPPLEDMGSIGKPS